MEFLDTAGVATLWGSVKSHVKSSIDAQQFKTINGTSVKGAGDIKIDLSLYKVVEVLPTSNIDTTKIYLVKDSAVANNSYSEYSMAVIYIVIEMELFQNTLAPHQI